jgi:hypothetical protein
MLKNDLWDRRVTQARYPTAKEQVENAMAPGAYAYKGIDATRTTRPNWGMLLSDGTLIDPLRSNRKAVMRATGQLILSLDELEGAPQPELIQSCANGSVRCAIEQEGKRVSLEYVLSMTGNVWGIRATPRGLNETISIRLYRHAEGDGIDAPVAGTDDRHFWIRLKMPADKTFSNGFELAIVGLVAGAEKPQISRVNGERNLGTLSPDRALRDLPGSAATPLISPRDGVAATMYVSVLTTADAGGSDVVEEGCRRVDAAAQAGYDKLVDENQLWYGDLYDQRENGRIFHSVPAVSTPYSASEDIHEVFNSWYCQHGGGTKTDMRRYQASAHYCVPEFAKQPYSGLPCYNEIFYSCAAVRGRSDAVDMWKQIVEHWRTASEQNARDVFGLPGIYITHGFLPPIKADVYIHTNYALEFAVDTLAQILKPIWDEWDYGGDEHFLRETCYPLMRKMCAFFAAFVTRQSDDKYHIVPCMQEECWGFYPGLSHNRDCISALTTVRWAFLRTIEAARLLGVNQELIPHWQEIADHLAPFPTWHKPEGEIFAGLPGVEPLRFPGDHPWDVGCYPARTFPCQRFKAALTSGSA